MFSESEVIISPHGTGLANLIFAVSETLVIELFDRRHVNRTYELISRSIGFEQEEDFPVLAPVEKIRALLGKVLLGVGGERANLFFFC